MNLFIVSDTHFTHAAMLRFTRSNGEPVRPFTTVEEVDELMVERWNATVRPQDHVYHLGDVAMRREHLQIVKRLNGRKRLVLGNHDIYDAKSYREVGFEKLFGIRVLDNLLLTHVPVHPLSMGHFAANVHGHVHNNAEPGLFAPVVSWGLVRPYINVSVEVTHYRPLALEEVKKRVQQAIVNHVNAEGAVNTDVHA